MITCNLVLLKSSTTPKITTCNKEEFKKRTKDVWSDNLGIVVDDDLADEIMHNIVRLADLTAELIEREDDDNNEKI